MDSQEIASKLKKLISSNMGVELSLDSSEQTLRTRRSIQHILRMKPRNKYERTLYLNMASHVLDAEKKCPGAGEEFLRLFSGSKEQQTSLVSNRPQTKSDIVKLLNEKLTNKTAIELLIAALDVATASSKIAIGKSNSGKTYIDVTNGYSFSVNYLLKMNKALDLGYAKVGCIDAYVENVSEIHHLLTFLSESSFKCILVVRGMSDDIKNTISVNNARGTLIVHPFSVPFDPENVNTIVDIAVAAGTDVISVAKGDIVSSLSTDKLGTAEKSVLTGQTIRFRNESTKKNVKVHVDEIKRKIEERHDIDTILSRRLKSLSSSCIDIVIQDDINYFSMSQQLDEGIRIITSIFDGSYDPIGVAKRTLESFITTLDTVYV